MRTRRTPRGTHCRTQRGAAAVEFALVMPFLMLLVFGVVDFGYMINRDTMVNNASREGVRTASLGATTAEVVAVVKAGLPAEMHGKVTVTVSCTRPTGAACATFDTDAASGGVAVVEVDYVHSWVTPVGEIFSGKTVTLSKTSRMRIE